MLMGFCIPMGALGGLTLASTGFTNAGTIAGLARGGSVGGSVWSNPTNAQTSNNSYATHPYGGTGYSVYLRFSNFGFAIPTGATILGIEVQLQRHGATTLTDSVVSLVNAAGSIAGNNNASGVAWVAADPNTYVTYGGSTDLWGLTLAEADIEDTDFGFVLSVAGSVGNTASIDHGQLNVHYGT